MWKFALGYVILQIRGLSLERFLNGLLSLGIGAWDVRRVSSTELFVTIPCKDFEKLRGLRRRCPCKIHIAGRGGMPFFLVRLWRRKILLFGMLLACSAIAFLSTRILFVSVTGVEGELAYTIAEKLYERGIRRGAYRGGIEWLQIATEIGAQTDGIKWLGLHQRGVLVIAEAWEATEQEPYPDYTQTRRIVADREGMITRISCVRGQAAVKVGDRVKTGDVLISDEVIYQDFPPYYTYAEGEVFAAMQYSATVTAPDTVWELEASGNVEPYFRLMLSETVLFETGCSFERYQLVTSGRVQTGEFLVPLIVVRGEYEELQRVERVLSSDEKRQWALMMAEMQATAQAPLDAEILVKNSYVQEYEGRWVATCTITTEEKIGVVEETAHE
ncbi:MAG: sporulation protein YqfD [Clostridia bacterium]|nr:sporulation protein YqfD [Clostridia bacterium]